MVFDEANNKGEPLVAHTTAATRCAALPGAESPEDDPGLRNGRRLMLNPATAQLGL